MRTGIILYSHFAFVNGLVSVAMYIYKITESVNDMIYIGQTTRTIEERFAEHAKADSLIGWAIRHFGVRNFKIEIIEECHTIEELCERERYWIEFFDCRFPNGYNVRGGGETGAVRKTPEDRRHRRTQRAIFGTFELLLKRKPYCKISIQEIIDLADIGRSTFYDHYDSKDALLDDFCQEFFRDVVNRSLDTEQSMFCRILHHLQNDRRYMLRMIARERNETFIECFKQNMNGLLRDEKFFNPKWRSLDVPEDFLIDHISSSFVNTIQWWVRNKMSCDPPTVDKYFRSMMSVII